LVCAFLVIITATVSSTDRLPPSHIIITWQGKN